jgi:GDPmannose 4,6-dehydratase
MKTALITGITGQDGGYLAEFLIRKGYNVYGMHRPSSKIISQRYPYPSKGISFIEGDLSDESSLRRVIQITQPDEIYNLGAQSSTGSSTLNPMLTHNVNALGVIRLIEIIKSQNPEIRLYQAGSSELFGLTTESPQTEKTPFHPRNYYGIAKLAAYWALVHARDKAGLFACNGISYNHESPRRGLEFVTRKITHGLCNVKRASEESVLLGNLDTQRDWGFAGDYVEAMWLMLQQDKPDDYVIATGETHSIRDFVEIAAKELGFDMGWRGKGVEEVGVDEATGRVIVKLDKRLYGPSEKNILCGDITKIKGIGWSPKTKLDRLIQMMIEEDRRL